MIIFYILPTDYRWYITHTSETENAEGDIRSVRSGQIIYPELEWEYDHQGVFTKGNFTMTLKYDSAALWTGLGLYGNLLAGLLTVGLILTTLVPVLGK